MSVHFERGEYDKTRLNVTTEYESYGSAMPQKIGVCKRQQWCQMDLHKKHSDLRADRNRC